MSVLLKVEAARREISARQRAQTDLWWLATEILGYDKLTKEFHKPMLDAQDAMRSKRRLKRGGGKNTLWIWPRGHYKTTCRKAQVIQDYLCDPTTTITWWHLVEEMAQEVSLAVGNQLQTNKELRKLFPEGVLPAINAKRFVGVKGFRLRSNSSDQAPSFRAWGWGSEATGGHSRRGYLDDPIGRSTIEDSQMPKTRSWYRNTVTKIVDPSGWLDASGTPWDEDDIYQDWMKSSHWLVTHRACLETDGVPDYDGKPVLLSLDEIKKSRDESGEGDFAVQMMCDPTPQAERPWNKGECEHIITRDEAMRLPGPIIVFSDPAPATVGSSTDDKKRDSGEKDFWAHAVIKFRRKGQLRQIILLDGAQSQKWTQSEGFRELCRFKLRYRTEHHCVEESGVAKGGWDEAHRRVSLEEGVRYRKHDLTETSRANIKNLRFTALCDRAKSGEFLISDGCSTPFLNAFLAQARSWRPLKKNRNSLKFDDAANVVSFAADQAFRHLTPATETMAWSPYRSPEPEPIAGGTRHVHW